MEIEISGPCCINGCANQATYQEFGESAHWLFIVNYCGEHHREIEQGTPVGPVGIDHARLEVHSKGVEEAEFGGIMPALSG